MKDSSQTRLSNQNGQLVIEAVLLIIILLGLSTVGVKALKNQQVASKLISGPWASVQGMTECGVWGQPRQVCKSHPNNLQRSLTYRK